MLGANIKIDESRLWDTLMEMAKVGPGVAGGNDRQALTDEDAAGRRLLQTWCDEAGLQMSVDTMGNMFFERPGSNSGLLPVYMGSHLDTQPTGGKFDGVLGVIGGLEVLRTLNDLGITTERPIVLTNWTNEEGARFAPAMVSSGVFAGAYTQEWAYDRCDEDGMRFGEELARCGWMGTEPVGIRKMHAYYELHIEQGPVLEANGVDIGVVTHGQGLWWLEVTLKGQEAHTGSTPMGMRRDAGLGASRIVELVHHVTMGHQPNAVGTVGQSRFSPNSRNVIPGQAVFTIDIRASERSKLESMKADVVHGARSIAADLGLEIRIDEIGHFSPVSFDDVCVEAVRNAATRLGYSQQNIVSGAGHDACWVNSVAPTAMIMCPCVGGLSHNEAEEIKPVWASNAANVLLHAVLETAVVV